MIDVSVYIEKLEVLKDYVSCCVERRLIIWTPIELFRETGMILHDKSGFVHKMRFEDFYTATRYNYQLERWIDGKRNLNQFIY